MYRLTKASTSKVISSRAGSRRSLSSATDSHSQLTSPSMPRKQPYRRGMLLVSIPIPSSAWPARLEPVSPLLMATVRSLRSHGLGVNTVWDGVGSASFPTRGEQQEVYPAQLVYPDGKVFHFEDFTTETLQDPSFLHAAAYEPDTTAAESVRNSSLPKQQQQRASEILICTHGSRDCRCADRGLPLVHAVRQEIERRRVQDKLSVKEIAHVGGHKWAANALLIPSLDMLSNLEPSHASALVSHVLDERPASSSLWAHWRGRIGLTEEAQASVWERVGATTPHDT